MTDCKVVLLTAPGRAALAGLAVLGPGASALVEKIAKVGRPGGPGLVRFAVLAAGGEAIDEAIVIERGAGHVELFCHGGSVSIGRVVEALGVRVSARASVEPLWDVEGASRGWDRIGREAAALLPEAKTERSVAMLLAQMDGALGRWVAARLAALGSGHDPRELAPDLAEMLFRCRYGRALVAPPLVAIAGPANAGKSTLLNRLYGEERAVVSETPGTTRDPVETLIQWEGIPLRLVDTAGISGVGAALPAPRLRQAGPCGRPITERGQARPAIDPSLDIASQQLSMDLLRRADWILAVFDGSTEDLASATGIWKARLGPRVLWIANKRDLAPSPSMGEGRGGGAPPAPWFWISAATGEGIDRVMARLIEVLAGPLVAVAEEEGEPCPFTERHEDLLGAASRSALQGDGGKVRSALEALRALL